MSNVSRNGMWVLAVVLASAVLAGGCKDDPAANTGAGSGGSTATAPAAGRNGSDPKATAVAFARAMQSNDMAAGRALSTGNEEQYRLLDSMSSLFAGMKNYETAAVAKFGEAGKTAGMPVPDMIGETEASEVKIEGDTATLINPEKPNDETPMKLVKKDGRWKVDLASMPMDEQTKQAAAAAPKMKKALDETAAEIKAGKYKTAQEAQQGLTMKMQGAMGPG